MSTTELKARLFKLIQGFDDSELLQEIFEILSNARQSKQSDWGDDLTESHLARLEESVADYKAGRTVSNEQLKSDAKKWLSE